MPAVVEVRRACDGPVEMGSVRDHLENRKECCVVVVGDSKVGKTALIHRFINDKFVEVGS